MTEAGASNVFYLDGEGIVRTSALNENILPGITREILIKALKLIALIQLEERVLQHFRTLMIPLVYGSPVLPKEYFL